jgi:hypothetical protein
LIVEVELPEVDSVRKREVKRTAIIFDVDGVVVQSEPFTFALEERHEISRAIMAPFSSSVSRGASSGKVI